MNTIAYITFRGMLGRRRALLLFILPAVLLLLSIGLRITGNADLDTAARIFTALGKGGAVQLATLAPLRAKLDTR